VTLACLLCIYDSGKVLCVAGCVAACVAVCDAAFVAGCDSGKANQPMAVSLVHIYTYA